MPGLPAFVTVRAMWNARCMPCPTGLADPLRQERRCASRSNWAARWLRWRVVPRSIASTTPHIAIDGRLIARA
jgi:hypothetical protein